MNFYIIFIDTEFHYRADKHLSTVRYLVDRGTAVCIELMCGEEKCSDINASCNPAVVSILKTKQMIHHLHQMTRIIVNYLCVCSVSSRVKLIWGMIMFFQWQILNQCNAVDVIKDSHQHLDKKYIF